MMRFVKTTKYFSMFNKECRKWISTLGLSGWRIYISNEDHSSDCLATASIETAQQSAAINLEQIWQVNKGERIEDSIKMAAFHEVFHVRLASLIDVVKSRSYDFDLVEKQEHALIYVLYPLLSGGDSVITIGEEKKK